MKKFFFTVVMSLLVLGVAVSTNALADEFTDTIEIYKKSEAVTPFFKNAYGYAVFPTVGKGALIVGGAYGTGQVYRGGAGWPGHLDARFSTVVGQALSGIPSQSWVSDTPSRNAEMSALGQFPTIPLT